MGIVSLSVLWGGLCDTHVEKNSSNPVAHARSAHARSRLPLRRGTTISARSGADGADGAMPRWKSSNRTLTIVALA